MGRVETSFEERRRFALGLPPLDDEPIIEDVSPDVSHADTDADKSSESSDNKSVAHEADTTGEEQQVAPDANKPRRGRRTKKSTDE